MQNRTLFVTFYVIPKLRIARGRNDIEAILIKYSILANEVNLPGRHLNHLKLLQIQLYVSEILT